MKVGIVGLGLIGGSLGLDLRSHSMEVLGVSRSPQTCERALARGVVDQAGTDLALLATAEVVFICTPIAAIAPTLEQLFPYLNPQTIVTDVGSVKASVVENCTRLWRNFVGGHPMAGTADQGIDAAQNDLFHGVAYVLTPTQTTPPEAVAKVKAIAELLLSEVYICSPQAHDRAVAWISHLPVVASASLIAACCQESEAEIRQLAQHLASSGFRDTSRVGGGNPELGMMMARYNRQELLRSLFQYRQTLNQIIAEIEQEDWQNLQQTLKSTQEARLDFLP